MNSSRPPSWLNDLTQAVAAAIVPTDVMPPLGCHFFDGEGLCEVTLFAAKTEVIGGERDGFQFPAEFILDIAGILSLFSDVRSIEWQALPYERDDEIGAHVAIEGTYAGEDLLLRIPAQAPDRFGVGRYANVQEMRFVDAW